MTKRLGPFATLARYAQVMQTPMDLYRYVRLRRGLRRRAPLSDALPLHVRTLGGAAMLCRPTQDVWTFKHTFLEGFHLPPRPLPAQATIVDLGSNIGYTVADLAYRHPSARVIGVEMDADNHALALRNTAWLGSRVEILRAAIWTHDGVVAYEGEADDAFTVTDKDASGTAKKEAPAKTLETLFNDFGLDEVDYIKMDIEGAEGAILGSAMPWASRVKSMKIEVHPPVSAEWCRAALEVHGFECWVDHQHWNCVCAVRR